MLPPSLRYCYTVWGIFYPVEILPLSVTSSCSFSMHQPSLSAATLSGIITTCGAQVSHLWYSHAVACIVNWFYVTIEYFLIFLTFWIKGSLVTFLHFLKSSFWPKVFFHLHLSYPPVSKAARILTEKNLLNLFFEVALYLTVLLPWPQS